MPFPPETLLLAALVVAFAYTAFGLVGFGSTVIALPLLTYFFALKFAVPLLMLLDVAAFLLFVARVRKRIQYAEIGWLVPFILAGMAAGLFLLIEVAEGARCIVGVMAESNLVEGRQELVEGKPLKFGQSITDPCLGWDDSVGLLDGLAAAVKARRRKGKR